MASHSLLVLVFAMSCFTSSSCDDGGDIASVPVTYPPRVLNTTQEECPPNDQRETVRAGVEQDLRNILRIYFGVYTDCQDALTQGQTTSGIYTIKPDNQSAFQAYCDMDGGGWTVFQRREDGSVNFYRNWADYQQGFGNLSGEFWLGLDKIHRLTSTATQLRVDLQDFEGNSRYAQYSNFSVGDSASKYTLSVSGYTGTAGDSLTEGQHVHNGQPFSTRDQDNDIYGGNCAQEFKGGWWYANCHVSNLNGLYHGGSHSSFADGVNWFTWKGYRYSLKFTEMKLRKN